MKARPVRGIAAALAVLVLAVVPAFTVGRFPVSPADLSRALLAKATGSASRLPDAPIR